MADLTGRGGELPLAEEQAAWLGQAKEVCECWHGAWLGTARRSAWPRAAADALRIQGLATMHEIQGQLGLALVTKAELRNPGQKVLLNTYKVIMSEKEQAMVEDLSANPVGQIFLLKAQHGYEDKSTVHMQGEGLADIIAKRTAHKAAEQ